MNLFQVISKGIRFVSEGVLRIFSPHKDNYPQTGVQSFTGDIPDKSTKSHLGEK